MDKIKTWFIWANFFGYFFCFAIGGSIAAIPRFIQEFENETGLLVFISEIIRIPITLLLLYFYTKYIVKLQLNEYVFNAQHIKLVKWILVGLSLPILTLGIFYITGILNLAKINPNLSQSYILDLSLKALGMSIASGLIEEIVFRAYLFNLVKSKYNFWVAAIIPSLFFTLLHIGGVGSLFNFVQLLVAGMLVSFMFLMIYVYTKSIWNAGIVHSLWNLLILNGLIAFGTNPKTEVLIQFNLGDNPLINGGKFGIEASIPAMIIYGVVGLILWKLHLKKQSMQA